MPIKPFFVSRILNGEKKVEFRRRFPEGIDYIVIYSSNPVKAVVGFFRVGRILRHDPDSIWRKYRKVGGISRRDFGAYYSGTDEAVAIEVNELFVLPVPLALGDLNLPPRAPQNFRYVDPFTLERLRKEADPAAAIN